MSAAFGFHCGRSWEGTRIEDACPCPQEPCGLVDPGRADPDCEHHPFFRSKSMRQGHPADLCPAGPQSSSPAVSSPAGEGACPDPLDGDAGGSGHASNLP